MKGRTECGQTKLILQLPDVASGILGSSLDVLMPINKIVLE